MSVEARPTSKAGEGPQGRRLESWKEIAVYLGRDVTTVRRWEKGERLPVHRHVHHKLGSVYAYTTELDACGVTGRQLRQLIERIRAQTRNRSEGGAIYAWLPRSRPWLWLWLLG
jgi:hypothetical protein